MFKYCSQVMKESYTVNKPRIAEDFIEALIAESKETGDEITVPTQHLNTCLTNLARDVMARERHNYDK